MNKYQCLEDRVLIRPIAKKESDKTESGLILDMVKKDTQEGEVVDVGGGRYAGDSGVFVPTVLHKGDVVLFGVTQGMELSLNGETLRLMREGDCLMLVSRKEDPIM